MPREIIPSRSVNVTTRRENYRVEAEVSDDFPGTDRKFRLAVHGRKVTRTDGGQVVQTGGDTITVSRVHDDLPAAVIGWLNSICEAADGLPADDKEPQS